MVKTLSFLPNLGTAVKTKGNFVDVPYISFKAIDYEFFSSSGQVVKSYSWEYTEEEKEKQEVDTKKQEYIDSLFAKDPALLTDSEKQEKVALEEKRAKNQKIADESTNQGEQPEDEYYEFWNPQKKHILQELILPVQGGVIETLSEGWGAANNVRLGLGVNLSNPFSMQNAKNIAAFTKRYLITEVLNTALKDLWKMGLHTQGQAFNEYIGMAYTAPDFRPFRFSFDLYPKNSKEADTIKRMIFAFKYYASPETDSGLSIKYPAMWEIDILVPDYEKNRTKKLMMIYYAGLRNITVNKESEGTVVFHNDGEPVKNHIEIEMTELNYLTRNTMIVEANQMWNKEPKDVLAGV